MTDNNWPLNYANPLRVKRIFVCIICSLMCSVLAAQRPWFYQKNEGIYQIQSTFLASPYSAIVDGKALESRVDINREVNTAEVSLHFEHGLSDTWDLMGNIPFRYVSSGDQSDQLHYQVLLQDGAITGLGNLEFALKRKLIDQQIKIATSARVILNTTNANLEKGLITGYDYNALGLFGHVGGSMGEGLYAFTDLGFVTTSNGFSDYFHQYMEAGYHLGRVFWIRLTLEVRKSMKDGDYRNETLIQTGLNPNDQEWLEIGLGLTYEAKNKIGFLFSTRGAIKARNVGYATPVTLGVYKKV